MSPKFFGKMGSYPRILEATLSTTVLMVAPIFRIIFWVFRFIALRRPFLEVLIKYAAVPAATDAAAIPAAAVAAILLFFIGCIIHHPIYRKIPRDAFIKRYYYVTLTVAS